MKAQESTPHINPITLPIKKTLNPNVKKNANTSVYKGVVVPKTYSFSLYTNPLPSAMFSAYL